MSKLKSPYTIIDGRVTYNFAQLYVLECPLGHSKFGYKTRLPVEDTVVPCVHCGTRCTVTPSEG